MQPDGEYTVQRFRGGFALVWWEIDSASGRRIRRRRTLTQTDRTGAEAEARRLWERSDSAPWTVGRLMEAYLATITAKPSWQRRQDAWKAMRPFWGDITPALIDEAMCRKYRATRRVSDTTARYELMQLSTALGYGATSGKIAHRPAIWLPATPERRIRHLSQTEFERFYGAVVAEHARLYVLIGLFTVARPGAILSLTWDRVDFMRRQIDFTTPGQVRTAKRRSVVAIGDSLLAALQRAYAGRTCEFVIERGGRQVASIKKAFLAASKRSNVQATPYTLRHTGAVWAAEAGVSMPELAQMMGHDDDRTTQKHYARFSPDHLRSVSEAIERKAQGSI